jgi:hypothetical protein
VNLSVGRSDNPDTETGLCEPRRQRKAGRIRQGAFSREKVTVIDQLRSSRRGVSAPRGHLCRDSSLYLDGKLDKLDGII